MIRFFERQADSGETSRAFEAFKVYRDLEERRSIDRAYRIYSGHQESTKRAPGRWKGWASRHDWCARAQAFDDYMEMLRRDAVEKYVSGEGESSARRQQQVQEELLDVKERLVQKLLVMANWPLEHRVVEVDEDGHQTVNIYPARWSFHTLIRGLEALDDKPGKIAFTDPSGAHQWGQSPDEIRRQFLELIEECDQHEGEE